MQRRRQGDHVLVIAADVQHQAHLLAVVLQLAGQADVAHAVEQLLVRSEAVGFADLRAQRQAQAVDVADFRMARLQILQPGQEVRAGAHHPVLVIAFGQHLHRLQAHRGAERVGGEGRMGRARRE
ncbi:hypothetical protein CATMIT_01773, partial [Catenibacterium mitsuokai DSM 15897]